MSCFFEGTTVCVTSPGFPWRIQHSSSRCCRVVVPTPRWIKHGVNTELAIFLQNKTPRSFEKVQMFRCCVIFFLVQSVSIKSFLFKFLFRSAQSPTPPVRDALLERFCQLLGPVDGHPRDCTRVQRWSGSSRKMFFIFVVSLQLKTKRVEGTETQS